MNKLILLRHGQSQWNLENRFTGWKDVPLTQQGMKEGAEAMKTAAADAVQSTKAAATGASQSAQTAASDAAQSAQDTGSWINKKVKENL